MAPSKEAGRTPLDEACDLMDMRKPLIGQVHKLNRAQYLAWTHAPFSFSDGEQKDALLFGSPYLEPFTKTAWYVIPLLWIPAAAWLAAPYALAEGLLPLLSQLVIGSFGFTLVEYLVHRFVFHVDDLLPDGPTWRLLHFLLHGIHHKVPMDRYRLVMPPVLGAVLASALYSLLRPAFYFVTLPAFNAACGGGLLGYVAYDMMHYSEHHFNFPQDSYFGRMKKYHMKHHFAGLHNSGYGITSKLWDRIFSTELDLASAVAAPPQPVRAPSSAASTLKSRGSR